MISADDNKGFPEIYQVLKRERGTRKKPENGLIQRAHARCKEYKEAKFRALMEMQTIRDLNRDFLIRSPGMLFRKKMPKADVVVAYAEENDRFIAELMKTFRVLAISKLKVHDTIYVRIFLRRSDAVNILNTFDHNEARKLRETKGLAQLVFHTASKWRFVKVFPPDNIAEKKGNKKFRSIAILATLLGTSSSLAGQIFNNDLLEPCWDPN